MRKHAGFTLIELLVVILILAILMAIALPLYLRAVADSELRSCQTNMQTIANAVQAYRVHSPSHLYPTDLTDAELVGAATDLQALPRCPNNGGYTITYEPTGADPTNPAGSIDNTTDPPTVVPGITGFYLTCGVHGDFRPTGVNP